MPDGSSPRSRDASKRSEEIATAAALRTFSSRPTLPLNQDQADPTTQEGKRRLTGAFAIDIRLVRPDPSQPRRTVDPVSLGELTESVRRWGILQPLTVRYLVEENVYQVITGERRFQAALKAGLAEIPCRVMNPAESDILIHQIIENWQRVDLEPFEIADVLAALKAAHGYTQKKLAELTGKSEGEISKLLSLLELSPAAQELARRDTSGRLSRRHLYAASRLAPDEQRSFLERIGTEALGVEEAEAVAAKGRPAASTPRRGAPTTRIRFVTREATVQITFRKKVVTPELVLNVLEDIRRQLEERPAVEPNIIWPK